MGYAHINDIVVKKICDAVAAGHARRAAAKAGGISLETLQKWIREGRRGEEPYAEFVRRLSRAEHEAESVCVNALVGAARQGNHQAALQWLERRRRLDWRPPSREDLKRAEKEDLSEVSLEELEKALTDAIALKKASRKTG